VRAGPMVTKIGHEQAERRNMHPREREASASRLRAIAGRRAQRDALPDVRDSLGCPASFVLGDPRWWGVLFFFFSYGSAAPRRVEVSSDRN